MKESRIASKRNKYIQIQTNSKIQHLLNLKSVLYNNILAWTQQTCFLYIVQLILLKILANKVI